MVFKGSLMGVSRMFQASFIDIKLHGCFKKVPGVFQECLKGCLRECQGLF